MIHISKSLFSALYSAGPQSEFQSFYVYNITRSQPETPRSSHGLEWGHVSPTTCKAVRRGRRLRHLLVMMEASGGDELKLSHLKPARCSRATVTLIDHFPVPFDVILLTGTHSNHLRI